MILLEVNPSGFFERIATYAVNKSHIAVKLLWDFNKKEFQIVSGHDGLSQEDLDAITDELLIQNKAHALGVNPELWTEILDIPSEIKKKYTDPITDKKFLFDADDGTFGIVFKMFDVTYLAKIKKGNEIRVINTSDGTTHPLVASTFEILVKQHLINFFHSNFPCSAIADASLTLKTMVSKWGEFTVSELIEANDFKKLTPQMKAKYEDFLGMDAKTISIKNEGIHYRKALGVKGDFIGFVSNLHGINGMNQADQTDIIKKVKTEISETVLKISWKDIQENGREVINMTFNGTPFSAIFEKQKKGDDICYVLMALDLIKAGDISAKKAVEIAIFLRGEQGRNQFDTILASFWDKVDLSMLG